eukprot:4523702-Pyramimonas_sp.AAC.2
MGTEQQKELPTGRPDRASPWYGADLLEMARTCVTTNKHVAADATCTAQVDTRAHILGFWGFKKSGLPCLRLRGVSPGAAGSCCARQLLG